MTNTTPATDEIQDYLDLEEKAIRCAERSVRSDYANDAIAWALIALAAGQRAHRNGDRMT